MVAELASDRVGPRTERHDDFAGLERALRCRDAPTGTFEDMFSRGCVAGNEAPAQRLEIGEISLVETVRVADRPGIAPAQTADEISLDGRFDRLQFA
ncbi:hypothetical protein D9M72_539980 [compost metagenome]